MVKNMPKRLVASDLRFNRMDAHNYEKGAGKRLASYPLLDEGIMGRKIGHFCYAREVVAHPPDPKRFPDSGGIFKKNEDIVDPETGTMVPLEFVRERDIYRPNIGLFIDPEDLDTHKKTGDIVVIPKSIIVLGNDETPFIQKGDEWVRGKPDEETRIPLAVSDETWNDLSDEEKRWFYRVPQQGVRFLVRLGNDLLGCYGRQGVGADGRPHVVHGVAFEEDAREAGTSASPSKLGISQEGGKLVVEGTPEQLEAALRALKRIAE
jgi:hypothetical protein